MKTIIRIEDGLGAHIETITDSTKIAEQPELLAGTVAAMVTKLEDEEIRQNLIPISQETGIEFVTIYFTMVNDGIIWQHDVPHYLNAEEVLGYLENIYGSIDNYSPDYGTVFNA